MAWEDNVTQVCGASRPRSVYELGTNWQRLGQALNQLARYVEDLGRRTENDGTATARPATPGWQGPVLERGKSWQGPAADAFRAHVQQLVKDIAALEEPANKVGTSVMRCADALATGISATPVPVFYDRDLPGGVDVEDLIGGKALNRDTGTEFAKRLSTDIGDGGEYYASGEGFKKRCDESMRWTGDGVVQGGKEQGGTPGLRWYELGKKDSERYQRERDEWYTTNSGASDQAASAVKKAYRDEYGTVAPGAFTGSHVSPERPFGGAPTGGLPGGSAAGAGGGGVPSFPGGATPSLGGGGVGPIGGTSPGGVHMPDLSEPGSGLAGAGGGGLGLGGGGLGVGGIGPGGGGLGLGSGIGAGRLGATGIGGAAGGLVGSAGGLGAGIAPGIGGVGGVGGLGRGAGGTRGGGAGRAGGGLPGMIAPGSASAGPGRSPMPSLTGAQHALSRPGMGMVPGGSFGGRAGDGADVPDATSWLTEGDDDVWGGGSDNVPPGVLG
jgi:uncharacterized protein YukE